MAQPAADPAAMVNRLGLVLVGVAVRVAEHRHLVGHDDVLGNLSLELARMLIRTVGQAQGMSCWVCGCTDGDACDPAGCSWTTTSDGPTVRLCRDTNCPICDWPETYYEANVDDPIPWPQAVGCSKCGWQELRGLCSACEDAPVGRDGLADRMAEIEHLEGQLPLVEDRERLTGADADETGSVVIGSYRVQIETGGWSEPMTYDQVVGRPERTEAEWVRLEALEHNQGSGA